MKDLIGRPCSIRKPVPGGLDYGPRRSLVRIADRSGKKVYSFDGSFDKPDNSVDTASGVQSLLHIQVIMSWRLPRGRCGNLFLVCAAIVCIFITIVNYSVLKGLPADSKYWSKTNVQGRWCINCKSFCVWVNECDSMLPCVLFCKLMPFQVAVLNVTPIACKILLSEIITSD